MWLRHARVRRTSFQGGRTNLMETRPGRARSTGVVHRLLVSNIHKCSQVRRTEVATKCLKRRANGSCGSQHSSQSTVHSSQSEIQNQHRFFGSCGFGEHKTENSRSLSACPLRRKARSLLADGDTGLNVPEALVDAIVVDQVLVGAGLSDPAAVYDIDLVRIRDGRQPMGDHDHGAIMGDPCK